METKEEFISIKDISEEDLDNYFTQDRELIEKDLRDNKYNYTNYSIDIVKGFIIIKENK